MSPSRIVELASIITSKTNQVDDYLAAKCLPSLSFEPNEESHKDTLPDSVQAAQSAILEATDELHALMLGPMGILTQQLVCLLENHAFTSTSDVLIHPILCR